MTYILVADDDDILAEMVCHRLCTVGHEAVAVGDGQQLLDRVEERLPDLILLDAMMPVKDGLSTLTELKQDPARCHVPVIMMTARRSRSDVLTALRAGAADYVTKPFSPEDLALRVEGLLARKRYAPDGCGDRHSVH